MKRFLRFIFKDSPEKTNIESDGEKVKNWIENRLKANGYSGVPEDWLKLEREVSAENAKALHRTLGEIVDRITSDETKIDMESSLAKTLSTHGGWIARVLTKNSTPLDGKPFARLFEYPGYHRDGAIGLYLWYAPEETLRSIEKWLYEFTSSQSVPVHDRVLLLRALGRLDSKESLRIATELAPSSPYLCSEVLGSYGAKSELEFMEAVLPVITQNEEARTIKHFKAGMRKIKRRLEKEGKRGN